MVCMHSSQAKTEVKPFRLRFVMQNAGLVTGLCSLKEFFDSVPSGKKRKLGRSCETLHNTPNGLLLAWIGT